MSDAVTPLSQLKNVLIAFTEDELSPSAALGYGLSLARMGGAHVTALSASLKLALTHALVSEMAAGLAAAENHRAHALAAAAAEDARQQALAQGIACTVETVQLRHADLLARFGALCRVHDLAVLDADPDALAMDRAMIDHALFRSGRPVMVVPRGFDVFRTDRIIVAWDGGSKAARALNDALPFLRAASRVEIVNVSGEKDRAGSVPGAEVAPHLARHGIDAIVTDLAARNGDVAETLRRHVAATRSRMIVMGAYRHSRLRELVLGGVTRSLLRDAPVPLFMSH